MSILKHFLLINQFFVPYSKTISYLNFISPIPIPEYKNICYVIWQFREERKKIFSKIKENKTAVHIEQA